MSRSSLTALVLAVVMVVVASCGESSHSNSRTTGSTRTLTDLHSINQLQTAFNTASGEPRLIVLVSPT